MTETNNEPLTNRETRKSLNNKKNMTAREMRIGVKNGTPEQCIYLNSHTRQSKKNSVTKTGMLKMNGGLKIAHEIQGYADKHCHKNVFQTIKSLQGATQKRTYLSETQIAHCPEIRSKNHQSNVMYLNNDVDYKIIHQLRQYHRNKDLDKPVSKQEIRDAITQPKNNKAVGYNKILNT